MQIPLLPQWMGLKSRKKKAFVVLVDPDKITEAAAIRLATQAVEWQLDAILVGGSLVTNNFSRELVLLLKSHAPDLPVVLFPGSVGQVIAEADVLLFLSLISGRNADLLIGRHVEVAPLLKQTQLEVIPTGYMLIESGKLTSANYISHTLPIPHDKPDLAVSTALAGEYLGLKLIYMDAGSGAQRAISTEMIRAVSHQVSVPLIIGGGIRSTAEAHRIWSAGADIIVVGTAIEKDPEGTLIQEIAALRSNWEHVGVDT